MPLNVNPDEGVSDKPPIENEVPAETEITVPGTAVIIFWALTKEKSKMPDNSK